MLTQSRIDTPTGLQTVRAGRTVPIGGVAWAQGRGIKAVEVRVDDGDWMAATMGPDAGIDYWRQWYVMWKPEAGESRRTLTVRATDNTARCRPRRRPHRSRRVRRVALGRRPRRGVIAVRSVTTPRLRKMLWHKAIRSNGGTEQQMAVPTRSTLR